MPCRRWPYMAQSPSGVITSFKTKQYKNQKQFARFVERTSSVFKFLKENRK